MISSVSFVSAFVPRAAVAGFCYHGDYYHAIEVVWNPRAVCYGLALGFKTGKHISKHRQES